nr:hypothetical protein [Tanacetum cinerariifolium]
MAFRNFILLKQGLRCGRKDKGKKVQNKRGFFEVSSQAQVGSRVSSPRSTRAKAASSKDDSSFLTISDDDEGLPDVLELPNANACHLKNFAITPSAWRNVTPPKLQQAKYHLGCYFIT